MTNTNVSPDEFRRRYGTGEQRERQGSQSHFIDLCAVLGVRPPTEEDPSGEWYRFEKPLSRTEGGAGFADVWRRGCFGWEYKGPRKNLDAALKQLVDYAAELENPPLLVVSDMVRIRVHTRFTNTVPQVHEWTFDDLFDAGKRKRLADVWLDPESFRPTVTRQDLTAAAARKFGRLGRRLQERASLSQGGADPRAIAHFLNQIVFCMFAEDARLLPAGLFTRTLRDTQNRPVAARAAMAELFRKMAAEAADDRFLIGVGSISWFNGGLFDGAEPLELSAADLKEIADTAADNDWAEIDPAIFGTLFEQALKATRERPALGAHYTDREKILQIVGPVVIEPLTREWEAARTGIEAAADEMNAAEAERRAVWEDAGRAFASQGTREGERQRREAASGAIRRRDEALGRAKAGLESWLARLGAVRVLDPACGSGNFLYVALHALKDLEQAALAHAGRLGIETPAPRVGLQCVRGIEKDVYAAELARVTLWIGDLQWDHRHGYSPQRSPVLSRLDQIETRDALLNPDGTEAAWPAADVIIGNPPFVGGKKLRDNLGDGYVERLFAAYRGRVPAEADLVAYWVEKAWRAVGASLARSGEGQAGAAGQGGGLAASGDEAGEAEMRSADEVGRDPPAPHPASLREAVPPHKGEGGGGAMRAGLVTTSSIRGGANRRVLQPIVEAGALWEAWDEQPWAQDGAAVEVSMLGFGQGFVERRLNGRPVTRINADLTATAANLTSASSLAENASIAFSGPTKKGKFEASGEDARLWLKAPLNPNGRPNADVVRPWWNGDDVSSRPRDMWIVDFQERSEAAAALYESPFRHVVLEVQPFRTRSRDLNERRKWWLLARRAPALAQATAGLNRVLVTPEVAKHRIFVWITHRTLADKNLVVIARDDDTSFGMLSSQAHRLWADRLGTSLEDRPRYTSRTTFRTFPFPEGLTPNIPAADYSDDPRAKAIAAAARELNERREAWLNPADLVRVEPEVVAGYPDRILPRDEEAARTLKTRTLTKLYNDPPQWLRDLHRRLDAAVAAAYGWTDWGDLPDDEILGRLFALNQARAAAGR